jgi:cytochrome c oxidase subunit II
MKKLLLLMLTSSCSANTFQSAWHPVSLAARDIKELTWFLVIVCTLVFLAVAVLLYIALRSKSPEEKSPKDKFILWTGLFIPTIILSVMLIYSLQSTITIRHFNKKAPEQFIIKVIGHQFWWEVHYPDYGIVTANELYIPVNTSVRLELTSVDVIHSFWVPNVHGKMDMIPGLMTYMNINVEHEGTYRGQCAEFCGLQHAFMAFHLKVLSEEEFNQWVQKKKAVVTTPTSPLAQRGKEVFVEQSCHTCHAIKNTTFVGTSGPDLTHIASRPSLGAGAIENNRETLKEWILHSQKIKPANRMPNYNINENDMKALLKYLEGLE